MDKTIKRYEQDIKTIKDENKELERKYFQEF